MKLEKILLLAVLLSMAAQAQEKAAEAKPAAVAAPDASLPAVEQILEKYVSAMGGKARIEKVTSRLIKGTFEMTGMGLKGTLEVLSKAPNKSYMGMTLPGLGVVQQGFNGTVGWVQDPIQGLRELNGTELAVLKQSADVHRDLNLKAAYTKMAVIEKAKMGKADVYVVEATPPTGGPEKLYFDTTSGLHLRTDMVFESPQGKLPLETYFEDYRDVGGVKLAHTVRQVNPLAPVVLKFEEVKNNYPVADMKFEKPKASLK
jgi:hypothetical protein